MARLMDETASPALQCIKQVLIVRPLPNERCPRCRRQFGHWLVTARGGHRCNLTGPGTYQGSYALNGYLYANDPYAMINTGSSRI